MWRIFVVEDDASIRQELICLLEKYGYSCQTSEDYQHLDRAILQAEPHLVLLDINLPYCDGYHLCRQVRRASDVPIIIVTSRDSQADELMGMNLGADDFIAKPYNPQILLARIASLLRRSYAAATSDRMIHREVTLLVSQGQVSYQDQSCELTRNELGILQLMMSQPGRIFSRDEIMNHLWQSDQFIDDNTLTVNINRLRKKLESIGIENFLITKRGQGYRI